MKIQEIDNGFLVVLVEDETLRTFNECNVCKYVATFEEVLAELKDWDAKIEKIRKEGLDEKETGKKKR